MSSHDKNWRYDSPSWWMDAIHWACCPDVSQGLNQAMGKTHDAPQSHSKSTECLEGITTFYNSTLSMIAKGDLPVERAASLLFLAKSLKKWKFADPSASQVRRKAALAGFLKRNYDAAKADPIPYPYAAVMKEILRSWLPEPERTGWQWTGQFGPGAVAEKWSHAQRFERLLRWCELSQQWPDRPLADGDAEAVTARLHAVPKDFAKDRLITIEPSYASFCQAYVREAMQVSIHNGPLRGTCMDLHFTDGQAIQRKLALKASRTKRLATLDLSDASDNITWHQVSQVFPTWLVAALETTRSSRFSLDEAVDDYPPHSNFQLEIYAGMGNGTTFTVETLFFAAFVRAYAWCNGLPTFASVFGDDIICHTRTATALMREEFSFFRINKQKSFAGDDALRESCGIFAYNGVDITCPKIDGFACTRRGRFGLADLIRRLHDLPWAYATRLAVLLANGDHGIPNWEKSFGGFPSIDSPYSERSPYAGPTRWNRKEQRVEQLLDVTTQKIAHYCTDWKSARTLNHPDPKVWLVAALCGMLGDAGFSITKPDAKRRWSIRMPVKGVTKTKRTWSPEVGSCWSDPYRIVEQWSPSEHDSPPSRK